MTKKTAPLKRDKNLEQFSHEHHHGLVFSSRLKKVSKTNPDIITKFVEDFWKNHLAEHFDEEERLFLPFLTDNGIRDQFLSEHNQIKSLVTSILNKNKGITENAIQLSELINGHIRFEERNLFPWLQKNLSANDLIIIGNKLKKHDIVAHNFTPEFWR